MSLKLYAHPFSSYSQKALIALYENGTPFEFCLLSPDHPEVLARFHALWPLKRFPILVDDGRPVVEASIIIEHLGLHHPGPVRLLPEDAQAALDVRMLDRFFDNYVSTPQQKIVSDQLRAPAARDGQGVTEARAMLDTAYEWLDGYMAVRTWAVAESFSLADCAAAPFLFYADWTHAIGERFAHLRAYRRRLLARPSVVRVVNEARPYRELFPLGAPNRD